MNRPIDCEHEETKDFKRGDVNGSRCLACGSWLVADGAGWRSTPLPDRAKPKKAAAEKPIDAAFGPVVEIAGIFKSNVRLRGIIRDIVNADLRDDPAVALATVCGFVMTPEDRALLIPFFDAIETTERIA